MQVHELRQIKATRRVKRFDLLIEFLHNRFDLIDVVQDNRPLFVSHLFGARSASMD